MNHSFADMVSHSFHRALDWRWQRANGLVERGRNATSRRDDAMTCHAARYLRAVRRGVSGNRVERLFGNVVAAKRLHESPDSEALIVQARLLARQSPAQIAGHVGVPVPVIEAYQELFFNCLDRIDTRDWISAVAIGFCAVNGKPAAATVLKRFAYHGGTFVLDAVLPYLVGGKPLFKPGLDLSTPEGRREQGVRLAVAVEMLPQDEKTSVRLMKIHLLMLQNRRNPLVKGAPLAILANKLLERLENGHLNSRLALANDTDFATASAVADLLGQAA